MRWPVARPRATPHGAYDYQRALRRHHGVDLAGRPGTVVVAPERIEVIATGRGLSTSRTPTGTVERSGHRLAVGVGLTGYGPGAVLAVGLDTGMVHVFGHLDAAALPAVGTTLDEGAPIGTISRVGHVHWEVRKPDAYPWPRSSRGDDVYDPAAVIEAANHLPFSGPAAPPPAATSTWLQAATDEVRARARAQAVGEVALVVVGLLFFAARRRR